MKIFVANTTKQEHELHYRVPVQIDEKTGKVIEWSERVFIEKIGAGKHVCLGGGKDFSQDEATALLDFHRERYGVVKLGEHRRGFVGQIWSLDRPVTVDAIDEGIEQNDGAADDRSAKLLENTAAAVLDAEQQRAQLSGADAPNRVQIEVIPENRDGQSARAKGAEAIADGSTPRKSRVG